jgi:hypothetical protein
VDIGSQMLMGEEKKREIISMNISLNIRGDKNLWGDGSRKQMRPGPATRAALLSRMF